MEWKRRGKGGARDHSLWCRCVCWGGEGDAVKYGLRGGGGRKLG